MGLDVYTSKHVHYIRSLLVHRANPDIRSGLNPAFIVYFSGATLGIEHHQ
ncbi:17151_t:CDS:2 [Entrophospora sp. SA101]|nr:17151_t:CDS:2 [Entrophospora sp. SA101]